MFHHVSSQLFDGLIDCQCSPHFWGTTEFEITAVCVAPLHRVSTQCCGGNASPHGAGCGIFTGLHNQSPRAFVDVSSEQNLCSWIIIRYYKM